MLEWFAGDDQVLYESLVQDIFDSFSNTVGVSTITGYNWNIPPESVKGETIVVKVRPSDL